MKRTEIKEFSIITIEGSMDRPFMKPVKMTPMSSDRDATFREAARLALVNGKDHYVVQVVAGFGKRSEVIALDLKNITL